MSDAARTADKYIQRSGAPIDYAKADFVLDLSKVANFILWHDENDMHGALYPGEAFEALCRVAHVEPWRLREIIKPGASQ